MLTCNVSRPQAVALRDLCAQRSARRQADDDIAQHSKVQSATYPKLRPVPRPFRLAICRIVQLPLS